MKKGLILGVVLFVPVFAFAQTALTLDKALSDSTTYLKSRLPAKSKVAVLNFTSDWPQLSNYIIEELMTYLVNEGTLTVVDRQNLEVIRKEMDFQMSGEVSDATAQSIGKKLGAQTIISGGIQQVGATYRLRIRAISVETAQVQGMQSVDVVHDNRLAALTGAAFTGVTASMPPMRKYVLFAGTEWRADKYSNDATVKNNTTIQYTIKREQIAGQDKEVLTVEANLAKGGNYSAAQIQLVQDDDKVISQEMEQGVGVRFKALGDGKKWRIMFPTKEAQTDFAFYQTVIKTKKGKVVDIDIPYAKLNQPKWGKPIAFNKSSIISLSIELNSEENSRGASTIKIFDFEIF